MATRTAGAAGSIQVVTKNLAGQLITPVSVPVVKWYSDADRTLGELTLPTTGSGSTYTSTWTAAQAPPATAKRYLLITIEVSTGVYDVDANDHIDFVDASASIDAGYVSLTEIRAFANLADAANPKTTDAKVLAARAWFESVFEDFTRVAWVPRATTERANGTGSRLLLVSRMFPRTPTAITVTTAGVATAFSAAELADVVAYDHGALVRSTLGYWTAGNRNVGVTYTHGPPPEYGDAPPPDVKEAALVAIADRCLNPDPTRQFSVATEAGIERRSTPGERTPFGIQLVDEVALRRSYRIPAVA